MTTTHPHHVKEAYIPKSFNLVLQALVKISITDEWAGCVDHKLLAPYQQRNRRMDKRALGCHQAFSHAMPMRLEQRRGRLQRAKGGQRSLGLFAALTYVHRLLPFLADGLKMETIDYLLGMKGNTIPDLRLLVLNWLHLWNWRKNKL